MVPNAEDLLIMEPEEIAGVILSYIHSHTLTKWARKVAAQQA